MDKSIESIVDPAAVKWAMAVDGQDAAGHRAKRILDVTVAGIILPVLLLPMLVIAVMVKLTSKGPVLYWSDRVGLDNSIFRMPKFRTMRTDTPEIATHLLRDAGEFITPIGHILRKTSADELPQLWSVLRGDLSLVGPRPALFNQDDLVELRTRCGIHRLQPGVTGWAQVNGRDELSIQDKVEYDQHYLANRSIRLDLEILFRTLSAVVYRRGIKH
jgi:O-antigen biosynthesis protein WbqP